MVRVAAVQLGPTVGRFAENIDAASIALSESLQGGADIVVLPELSTSGYVFETREEAWSVAIRADNALFERWAALAAHRSNSVIVAGFAERGDDDELYNSAVVIAASGVIGVYRKVHLWNEEKNIFRPGQAAPLTIDTVHGRLGVMICYDLEFPEWTRTAALAGVDLLAVPTNWPITQRPKGERIPEVQIAMAAARVNRMAIVCADRTRTERGVEWSEGTTFIGSDGWIVSSVGAGTGTAWADYDPRDSQEKRLTELSHVFDDRFPALYSSLGLPSAKAQEKPMADKE